MTSSVTAAHCLSVIDLGRSADTGHSVHCIDYCNAVLYGATAQVVRRLQM